MERPQLWEYSLDTLKPEDLPDIMEVERACFAHPWKMEDFASQFDNGLASFLGVRHQGHVVAVMLYWLVFPDFHILSLGVHPEHRRRGLAVSLLQVLFEMGREIGAERIDLEVREHNTAAQSLYSSVGFVQVGRRKKYYSDTGEDALLYTYYFL